MWIAELCLKVTFQRNWQTKNGGTSEERTFCVSCVHYLYMSNFYIFVLYNLFTRYTYTTHFTPLGKFNITSILIYTLNFFQLRSLWNILRVCRLFSVNKKSRAHHEKLPRFCSCRLNSFDIILFWFRNFVERFGPAWTACIVCLIQCQIFALSFHFITY